MKFSIERGTLLKAVSQAQSVVERRNTIPILSNVLIEAEGDHVRFRATDLDIEVVDEAPAQIHRAGATTVNAVMFHEIARKLPDGALVELATDPGSTMLSVTAGRAHFKLATLPKEDFPVMASSPCSDHGRRLIGTSVSTSVASVKPWRWCQRPMAPATAVSIRSIIWPSSADFA